eukprot:scaffold11275_cov76-Phaeocystis_antarctica.AAC.1
MVQLLQAVRRCLVQRPADVVVDVATGLVGLWLEFGGGHCPARGSAVRSMHTAVQARERKEEGAGARCGARTTDVGRSWLKVALWVACLVGRPTGECEDGLQSQRAGVRGEAQSIVYESNRSVVLPNFWLTVICHQK